MQHPGESSIQGALDAALVFALSCFPTQGPIGSFLHLNALMEFQSLPFHQAVRLVGDLRSAEVYLSEAHYRRALRTGRIGLIDLEYALELRAREVDDEQIGPLTRHELERLVLEHGVSEGELTDALPELPESAQALYALCRQLAPLDPPHHASLLARVGVDRTARDLLVAMAAQDPSELSNPVLIDFLGAYLDEGMARWAMPDRDQGLLRCFHTYLASTSSLLSSYEQKVLARLEAALDRGHDARQIALDLLAELGVEARSFKTYVARTLLELPGWSGMVGRLEQTPGYREPHAVPVSLLELTAIRLLLDLEAYAQCAKGAGHTGPLPLLRDFAAQRFAQSPRSNSLNASHLFDACVLADLTDEKLAALGKPFAERVCALMAEFDEHTRRRLLHEAYERSHLREVLDAVALHRTMRDKPESQHKQLQIIFCFDDREEGIRRYVEEQDAGNVTFGAPGFFGVAMRWRGIDDVKSAAFCPAVVTPGHEIEESPLAEHESALARRALRRKVVGRVRFEMSDSSRSMLRGLALTPILGVLSAFPLIVRVLFPHAAARLERWVSARAFPAPKTQLVLSRVDDPDAGPGSIARGFTVAEQADRVAAMLENIGLVKDFAPIVSLVGHGASMVNNPHVAAYACAACGGRNGGPNARTFSAMANNPAVRELLRKRNIDIPDSTWFIGALHDTTTDAVALLDVELVPEHARANVEKLRATLDDARAMSAFERCRKFEDAPRRLTPRSALKHVEERAVDLSQARSELGHATNAVCIIGRRDLSRGLFLDRRAFLLSYSAGVDPQSTILERVLAAAVPVGANINLDYYFSAVDNEQWGAGTKLPHNLSGLLGVMEGSCGDLRVGLPRQMVELHDPLRLLAIIEAKPSAILDIASRHREVAELVSNGWIRLATLDYDTGELQVFENGTFRPYTPGTAALHTVSAAEDWYRGQPGILSPVRIVRGRNRAA